MRIAIDARWIFPEISGIGQYTTELIRHLTREESEAEYILIFSDREVHSRIQDTWGRELPDRFSQRLVPYGVFSPWNQIAMPWCLKGWAVDVYHSPNYMIPFPAFPRRRKGRIKCVTTIHDVIPLIFPNHAPKSKKSRWFPLFCRIMRETASRSHAIITVSRTSARDIIEQLRIPAGSAHRVHTVYNGVSAAFCPAAAPGARAAKPTGKTVLYVGRSDPYKNVTTLIRAFADARAALPFPVDLQVIGPPDPRYPEAPALAQRLGLGDAVRWTGYLSNRELVATYRNADLLVHPSRYEGFGLQVLEAMACGVPVLGSDAGALQEVVGDAGILVPPDDVNGFARHIRAVLSDPELARSLSVKGLHRAKQFSWGKAARQTLSIYRSLAHDE